MNPTIMNKQRSHLFNNIIFFVFGVLFLTFPLIFSSMTTDFFGLPKQVVLSAGALITLVLWGLRMVTEGEVRIRRTPFDLPILFFTIVLLLSALFSLDRADGLTAFVPF